MGRNPDVPNKKLMRLLLEYLKDSNRSDREIAKELGFSQATVSRLKAKLLKDGIVTRFSAIPDLPKMGYEIMVFSLVKYNMDAVMNNWSKVEKIAKDYVKSNPEIVFDAMVEGVGVDVVTISVHKNYAAYKEFLTKSKSTWGEFLSEVDYILVDLKGALNKPFSFDNLVSRYKK